MTQPETSQSYDGNQIVQTTIIFRTEESYYTFVPTAYIYTSLYIMDPNKSTKNLQDATTKTENKNRQKKQKKIKEEGKNGKGTLLITAYCTTCILMRTARLLI